jgi:hypothetical protein
LLGATDGFDVQETAKVEFVKQSLSETVERILKAAQAKDADTPLPDLKPHAMIS